jgi:hypothetical protein
MGCVRGEVILGIPHGHRGLTALWRCCVTSQISAKRGRLSAILAALPIGVRRGRQPRWRRHKARSSGRRKRAQRVRGRGRGRPTVRKWTSAIGVSTTAQTTARRHCFPLRLRAVVCDERRSVRWPWHYVLLRHVVERSRRSGCVRQLTVLLRSRRRAEWPSVARFRLLSAPFQQPTRRLSAGVCAVWRSFPWRIRPGVRLTAFVLSRGSAFHLRSFSIASQIQ